MACVEAVVQQDAVGQAGQRIVSGEMPQLPVGRLQSFRARGDDLLERFDLPAQHALVLPFARQRAGALQRLRWARMASSAPAACR